MANQKTKQKQLFHTSEKSNFILNMQETDFRRYCCNLILLTLGLLLGSGMLYELTMDAETANKMTDAVDKGGFGGVLTNLLMMLRSPSSMLAIGGVSAIIFALIGLLKRQYQKQVQMLPAILLGASLCWGAVSVLWSYDSAVGMFGIEGRSEGMLALIFYACLFLLGTFLYEGKLLDRLRDWAVGFGLFQCVWGLLQCLPFWEFPSSYQHMFPVLQVNSYLPSGMTGSPVLLALLLSLLGGLALSGAFFAAKKGLRVYHTVAVCVFLVFLLKTQCVSGIVGAVVLVAGAVMLACMYQDGVKRFVKCGVLAAAVVAGAVLVFFAPVINGTEHMFTEEKQPAGYQLYDGAIIWTDGYYRNSVCGQYVSADAADKFEMDDAFSVYGYCWDGAMKTIRKFPVLGTGADNYIYSQLRSSLIIPQNANITDNPYNLYLSVAATRGIVSAALYLALLVIACARGMETARRTGNRLYLGVLIGLMAFSAAAFFGMSAITVSPYYWVLLGVACSGCLPVARKK